jgi:fructose-1-phosphate kinase PfkB-like protein
MAKILVAGLNPAWQQVLVLSALKIGEVNRAAESFGLAGGKGMNAAKILARAGHEVSLLQVLAGPNGDRMLDGCTSLGIQSLHAFVAGETRAAVTLVHEGVATEIIEPFSVGERREGPDLATSLLETVPDDVDYDALLVCGTLPAGLDPDFYARLLERVRARTIVWDSVVGFSAEVARRITWLKVNADEHRALAPWLEEFRAHPALLVTDGPRDAVVRHPEAGGSYRLPPLGPLVSPIGAGDTVTAILVDGLLHAAMPVHAAISRALACSMASCLSPLPAEWNAGDAAAFEKEIAWTH